MREGLFDCIAALEQEEGRAPYFIEVFEKYHKDKAWIKVPKMAYFAPLANMFIDDILLLNSENDRVSTTRRPGYTRYSERLNSDLFTGFRVEPSTLQIKEAGRGAVSLKKLMAILASKDF
eukprot:CAMPEP_0170489770 /NCGR_PEP_ID=MMETSP0208-20121228/8068_1 /TAXON_ID=197538 /ORGANISM="Strombidium inclinatum, Strain S3" /LENGTH=119 /DNA_ID=CAMNT_0010764841 /DNA_START=20 /DNA_END=379 /DNA_ORIENTATION=+